MAKPSATTGLFKGAMNFGQVFKDIASSFKEGVINAKAWNKTSKDTWAKRKKMLKDENTKMGRMAGMAKGGVKFFSGLTSALLDVFGIFMQFAQATGILQPIMELLTAVFQIIGAVALETMLPAFIEFADTLFSPESMELWTQIGEVLGGFFSMVLGYFTELLKTKAGRDMILKIITGIVDLLTWLGGALGIFLNILTIIPPSVLGGIIFAFGVFFAFMQGMMYGGVAGAILGSIYAGIAAAVLWPLLTLQTGGIVTKPTQALIGEGGEPEAVIPLSKAGEFGFGGGGTDQVLWATEENGLKLDRLIAALEEQNRLKRIKNL